MPDPRPFGRTFGTTREYGATRTYGQARVARPYGASRSYAELAGDADCPREPRRRPWLDAPAEEG